MVVVIKKEIFKGAVNFKSDGLINGGVLDIEMLDCFSKRQLRLSDI